MSAVGIGELYDKTCRYVEGAVKTIPVSKRTELEANCDLLLVPRFEAVVCWYLSSLVPRIPKADKFFNLDGFPHLTKASGHGQNKKRRK